MNPMTHQAPFVFHPGTQPFLISMPQAREVHDTDWYLDRLYDFAVGLGASILQTVLRFANQKQP